MEGPPLVEVPMQAAPGPPIEQAQAANDWLPGWSCLCGEHTTVTVQPRTWAYINKHGGIGRIVKSNGDGTYSVRYLLGGSEKSVDLCFIQCNVEVEEKREGRTRGAAEPRSVAAHPVASKAADRPCPRKTIKPPAPETIKPKAQVEAPKPKAQVEAPVQAKKVRQPMQAIPPPKKAKSEVKKAAAPPSLRVRVGDENCQPRTAAFLPTSPPPVLKTPVGPAKPSNALRVLSHSFNMRPLSSPSPQRAVSPVVLSVSDSPVISDERTKEFNCIITRAFGSTEMLMLDDIRNKCPGFTTQETDCLVARIEKEGKILIDGDCVYCTNFHNIKEAAHYFDPLKTLRIIKR